MHREVVTNRHDTGQFWIFYKTKRSAPPHDYFIKAHKKNHSRWWNERSVVI